MGKLSITSEGDTSSKHEVLYHYTPFENFEKIFRSQELWAKCYRHMNDSSEIVHARLRLKAELVPRFKREVKRFRSEAKSLIKREGGIAAVAEHEADALLDALFENAFSGEGAMFTPFLTSFCSHTDDDDGYTPENGLLSMWRGYGADGGVAIVLNTKKLERKLKLETDEYLYHLGNLSDVVYDGLNTEFFELFGEYLDKFREKTVELMWSEEGETVLDDEFIRGLFSICTRFKHQAFREEREVRIALTPWTGKAFRESSEEDIRGRKLKEKHFYDGAEYVHLFDGDQAGKLPIERVIVGPHLNQDQRTLAVESIVGKRSGIDVTKSKTPFVLMT